MVAVIDVTADFRIKNYNDLMYTVIMKPHASILRYAQLQEDQKLL